MPSVAGSLLLCGQALSKTTKAGSCALAEGQVDQTGLVYLYFGFEQKNSEYIASLTHILTVVSWRHVGRNDTCPSVNDMVVNYCMWFLILECWVDYCCRSIYFMKLLELCTIGSVFESACLIRFSEFSYVVTTRVPLLWVYPWCAACWGAPCAFLV